MARRLINALSGTGRCSSAFGPANAQLLDSLSSLLPSASSTLSGGSWGQASVLMQQQQFSAGTTHICSQHCSCNQQAASLMRKSQFQSSSLLPASSTRLGIGAVSQIISSSLLPATATAARAFASFTGASAHSGCGHSHHHDEPCSDETTAQIRQAADLQKLQQLVQGSISNLTAQRTAAAFRRAALLCGKTPSDASDVLQLLVPAWPRVLAQADGKDLADVMLSWTKFQTQDEGLWADTVAAVRPQIKVASGQDLANIAYALAAMTDANGGIPGVPREAVQELLRVVTEEVVSLVQGKGAGDGCAGERSVSVGNLATVRWAHEVFEESGGSAPA